MSSVPEVVDALAGSRSPYLIGVRHHSPALSVVVPELLDAYRPEVLLVELPPEFTDWLPWLANPATAAPVALAGVVGDGGPAFYPFADFSPELVAIRWAFGNGVPVVPCDLPLADPAWRSAERGATGPGELAQALQAGITGRADEDMWDRTVEARAPGTGPEALRRAALAVGWALRDDAVRGGGVPEIDLCREAWMRRCVAAHPGRRVAALVGSFHAAAFLAGQPDEREAPTATVTTSLVPYTFGLLDARSGYPAGIRDPQWQQAVLEAAGDPYAVEAAATASVVRVCAGVRAAGHPAGPAEAREAVRLATDLARLRGLPAPGRGELVEALQSVLAHGEVLGRGRAVATAMERVMVGDRRGALAKGTPRSGLGPAVRDLLAALKLPGPGERERDLRLDPLRSDLDRRREVTLHRLAVCDIPYGTPTGTVGVGGADALTSRWTVHWTPETDAMLDVAGLRGVVLAQATEGALRERRRREVGEGGPTAQEVVDGLHAAAVCGLAALTAERLTEVGTVLPASGTLAETIGGLALLDRIGLGHIAGLAVPDGLPAVAEALESAAVRQVDGLAGSEDVADVHALAALAQRAEASGVGLRLADALDRLSIGGTPVMGAAAGAVQVLLGLRDAAALGLRIASWVDTATTPEARRALRGHLTGVLAVAEPLLHTGGDALTGLLDRVESLTDTEFLDRLPALRGGFHVLSPAARGRLLEIVDERLGGGHDVGTVDDPRILLARLLADKAGREALSHHGFTAPSTADDGLSTVDGAARKAAGDLSAPDRWRLVLGRERDRLGGAACRYATALDELYGTGLGEGSRAEGAGQGPSYPRARDWAEELNALFGAEVREEVLASAMESGRSDVALLLDPGAVRPSVELLQTVLSLAGGLPESTVARLRPLIARIIEELTRQLATRLRPALSGITTPRPTYRPGGPLDLARTLRRNLAVSHLDEDGRLVLVPERPVFRTRSRRSMDWRLILVVDVSGSMEASVIWSALTSAVLAGVPALTTHFVAFSTEVVDLTDRVHDPLSLLLEVSVGGGTHIAAGLRYARELVTVPARTLVVVVSDFEEGYPVSGLLAEVRALAESGATLLGCASLDDAGRPRYSVSVAGQLVAAGMPVAALSPLELARWVGEQVTR
jgi:Mg-chelatase subunit ChlD